MDEKELHQETETDLDSILSEFQDSPGESTEDNSEESISALLENLNLADPPADKDLSETDQDPVSDPDTEVPEEEIPGDASAEIYTPEDDMTEEGTPEEESGDSQAEVLNQASEESEELPEEEDQESEFIPDQVFQEEEIAEMGEEEAPPAKPISYDPQAGIRELKHKLVSGPEKRYYDLTELGVGRLQLAILINVILVALCTVGAVLFAADRIPENRMRLLIFSQVLAMLISGLLGLNQILDGMDQLFRGRFTINTMLGLTFLACIADGFFSLKDLRVPCCCAFCLEMVFALSGRCQRRNTETGQMDTLRKAVRLYSIKKVPEYYNSMSGLLRGEGRLEDFMDTFENSTGPEKLQSFYAFFSFLLCIGIAVLAGMMHGVSMAVQILATSLLVAVPASFFIALTRPAAILERRLHMVGAVLCGWNGVKALSGKAAFPITGSDLFPQGSTKLNGIKFYSDRDPDMIVSYTSSLILESGSSLIPVFEQLMNSRGVVANPVRSFHQYQSNGIGGDVCGEKVLLGSTEFLQEMGVDIPEGSMVSQAVYAAIDGELCAVVAISFAKMRSAAAGMVTLCGYRKLSPMFVSSDFVLTEAFLRSKFEIHTKRLQFPSLEQRAELRSKLPQEDLPGLALSTRPDLISFAYAVTGARALRTSCKWGMMLHLLGGILGLLSMLVLAITGSTYLLTPVNVLLYQLVWLVPGFLITEWARHV